MVSECFERFLRNLLGDEAGLRVKSRLQGRLSSVKVVPRLIQPVLRPI